MEQRLQRGKGHLDKDHDLLCPRKNLYKVQGSCDCEPRCLNCDEHGHLAIDVSCKARHAFRIPARGSINNDLLKQ